MITNTVPPKSKKRNPGSYLKGKSIEYEQPSDEVIKFFNNGGDK